MYKLTLILFALFSLVLPILAVPVPAADGQSNTLSGEVRASFIHTLLTMLIFWFSGNLVSAWPW
jgi:hypothetical protein